MLLLVLNITIITVITNSDRVILTISFIQFIYGLFSPKIKSP